LSIFQNLFISYSIEQDYLIFIYPDFIFSPNSFNFLLNSTLKNYSAIFCPVPQINTENVNNDLTENNIDKFLHNIEENIYKNIHNVVLRTNINDNQIASDSSVIAFKDNDYILLNSFHIHPLAIKVQKSNFNFFKPFFPSFDESFVSIYEDDEDYFIPKDSNQMIFASLASKYELQSLEENLNGNIESLSEWASRLTNFTHRKFVKHSYILKKNNNSEIDFKESYITVKNFIDELLLILSRKKTRNNYNYINNKLLDFNFKILQIKIREGSKSISAKKKINDILLNEKCDERIKKIMKRIHLN